MKTSYTGTGLLFILLIVSSHLIGIEADIRSKRLGSQHHLSAGQKAKARAQLKVKTRGIDDPKKQVDFNDFLSMVMGYTCLQFTGPGMEVVKETGAEMQKCIDSPPNKPDDCDADKPTDKPDCKEYNECRLFFVTKEVTLDTLAEMPSKSDFPGLDRLDGLVVPQDGLIQTGSQTGIVLVDDILLVAGTCISLYKFIDSLIKWFKPAELSSEQREKLDAWLDYAKVVIKIASNKLEEYANVVNENPPEADVSVIKKDLDLLDTTLAALEKEVSRILGLMKQCAAERDREPDGGVWTGAAFSLFISYAFWWNAKNQRIDSWHGDVMCGVDRLTPRCSAVRTAMEALHADMTLKVFSAIKDIKDSVSAPKWGDTPSTTNIRQ